MTTVHVKLFATLRQYKPGLGIAERFPLELPDSASIRDLTQQLELPEEQVKLILVNGLYQDL